MLQPTGTKVGKYEIRAELGRGAMGVVYVAHDPILDRKVALKVMAANILEDPDLKERFRREAQAVAKLQSPNIVTVYDFGYHQDAPYIAMEMLTGTDLEAKLRSSSPPSLKEKIEVVRQVCTGLSHAHEHGIVHRDIKPANVFVTASGLVKIMDFGTARLAQSTQTQTGTVMGTVAYMSPEQIQGQKVDGRSDIFSLGVLFYRLLCHQQPFGGENIHHIIYKILNVQPANLVLPEGVQVPSLQHIVDRALAKDLTQRYQTADEMARDLQAFQSSTSTSLAEDTVFRTLAAGESAAVPQVGSSPSVGGATIPVGGAPTMPVASTAGQGSGSRNMTAEELEGETIKTEQLVAAEAQPSAPPPAAGHYAAKRSKSPPWVLIAVAAAVATFAIAFFVFSGRTNTASSSGADTPVASVDPPAAQTAPEEVATTTSSGDVTSSGAGEAADGQDSTGTSGDASTDPATASGGSEPQPTVAQATAPPPPAAAPPPPRPQVQTPPPSRTTASQANTQRVRSTVDNVRTALGGGQLSRAQELIEEGRQLDPANEIWDLLENERLVEDNNLRGNTLLNEGLDHFTNGKLDEAVAAYDKAIQAFDVAASLAPGNSSTLQGKLNASNFKAQAVAAQRQQQAAPPPSATPSRQFDESATTFAVAGNQSSGFEQDDKVNVQQATRTTSIPGELIIELVPRNVEVGSPYFIKVRLRNKSNSALFAKSMELVSTFKGRSVGAGQPIQLDLRRADAQSTVVLFETQDVWTEDLDQGGKIEVKVTLAKKGDLLKTLTWSAP